MCSSLIQSDRTILLNIPAIVSVAAALYIAAPSCWDEDNSSIKITGHMKCTNHIGSCTSSGSRGNLLVSTFPATCYFPAFHCMCFTAGMKTIRQTVDRTSYDSPRDKGLSWPHFLFMQPSLALAVFFWLFPQSQTQWIIVMKQRVSSNVKISRLPVLPVEVQVI